MKAVAYQTPGPIDREDALVDITLDTPTAEGRDLLVKIHAVSVNPADVKVRAGRPKEDGWAVLGWDASGVVEAVGPDVTEGGVRDLLADGVIEPVMLVRQAVLSAAEVTNAILRIDDIVARRPTQ